MNDKAKAVTRRYIVKDKTGTERLVRATGPAQAVGHVYQHEVKLATADDLERLIRAGTDTETAGE